MDLTDSASRLHVSASTSMGLELGAELISEILMDLGKVVDNFVNDESTDTGHTCSNVLYQTVTMSLIKNLEPELSWLTEVVLLSRINRWTSPVTDHLLSAALRSSLGPLKLFGW